jgi:signal peptidase I
MAKKDKKPSRSTQSQWKNDLIGTIWTLLFIVFLRVYILEPYVIPSESMVPTLLVGDHVFVARGAYDFKLPFTNISLVKVSDPQRGDVVVFDYPVEDSRDSGKFFVKRVVGIPGDSIEVRGGVPIVNGKAYVQTNVTSADAKENIKGFQLEDRNQLLREEIPGAREVSHWVHRIPPFQFESLQDGIQYSKEARNKSCINVGEKDSDGHLMNEMSGYLVNEVCPTVVPQNKYFVMGDNRDNSSDGRIFGFVDRSLVKGRVLFIWFSPPPGEVNPYTSGLPILAAFKDMLPGMFRMIKDPGRLSRVGSTIR